jgi:hypothetical protein
VFADGRCGLSVARTRIHVDPAGNQVEHAGPSQVNVIRSSDPVPEGSERVDDWEGEGFPLFRLLPETGTRRRSRHVRTLPRRRSAQQEPRPLPRTQQADAQGNEPQRPGNVGNRDDRAGERPASLLVWADELEGSDDGRVSSQPRPRRTARRPCPRRISPDPPAWNRVRISSGSLRRMFGSSNARPSSKKSRLNAIETAISRTALATSVLIGNLD